MLFLSGMIVGTGLFELVGHLKEISGIVQRPSKVLGLTCCHAEVSVLFVLYASYTVTGLLAGFSVDVGLSASVLHRVWQSFIWLP